ncbi:ATP-binding protein [Blastomonas sp.]|uniref:ATP-binding protein n=1 Tax=Blastomonas sp. TaxID=1909299 RepID=UPI00260B56B0|nr:ATP-binding protein [Blastomonas sp.]MDM7956603.1 ATP-binding protein [Blastomonas sp.]
MKVKRIHLKSFKRFTDLEITGIPEAAKLVVVVGPNGSGKSSLFDAFMSWHRQKVGWGIDGDQAYYQKGEENSFSWNQSAVVETHEGIAPVKSSLYVRTAYRNDADFTVGELKKQKSPSENLRIQKSIQNDQVVSLNYQRLIYDTISGVYNADNNEKTVENLRNELIGGIRHSMKSVFGDLMLNNISDPLGDGTFNFSKGSVASYHYKNLSGGEKAAFDLLLDMHMKRKFYADAIWCIDELETHLHTRVQGALMREMYALIPEQSQLWITTHSLGVMRAAQALSIEAPGTVAIIDFDGVEPDEPRQLVPSSIGRIAWEKMLSIAIDDLSSRIVPSIIVVCEGSAVGNRRKNFDAEIYNRVLGSSAAEIVFVSGGSSNQVATAGASVRSALDDIANGARVISLCDRDDKSQKEVQDFEKDGNLVLGERNLECYLFADDVLTKLAQSAGHSDKVGDVLQIKADALAASVARGNQPDDLKSAAGQIFTNVRQTLTLARPGNTTDAFMRDTLAPLITPGMPTHAAMKAAILDRL